MREIDAFTRSDIVIVCGGSNDACKNETQVGLNCLNNFCNSRTNTNIMIISVPQRHDLSPESCVNKEILTFNRKLHKLMKNKESITVLDCNIPREGFTGHGLHHNSKGKSMLAQQIMHKLIKHHLHTMR
jgi:lysophospholipase L1-like esterase